MTKLTMPEPLLMRSVRHYLACAALLLGLIPTWTGCSTARPDGGWTALFNGRDLSGWVVMHGGEWTVEDHALVGRNGRNWSTNPEESGSWLRTEIAYADFELELEYAIEGNSGIFLRSAPEKNPAFTGYEMQILADYGRPPSKASAGSLYDVASANVNMSKPGGEWNHVKIRVQGSRIQITWNGEPTLDFGQATRSARGYIGLQNHDERSVVRFRDIRLREL